MATTPAPTPGRGKKWWIIHVSAGIAAMALIAFGLTQCDGKNDAQSEAEKAASAATRAMAKVDSLLNVNRDLSNDNLAKADTIRMQRDSIIVLNDSLDVVNGQLRDCRNSKKTKKPAVKPVPVKTTPAKPDTVIVVVKSDEKTNCPAKTRVELDNSQNDGAIIVSGQPKSAEVKLTNGSTNNGAIIIGDNNHVVIGVPADTLKQVQQAQAAFGYVKVKRVYHTR